MGCMNSKDEVISPQTILDTEKALHFHEIHLENRQNQSAQNQTEECKSVSSHINTNKDHLFLSSSSFSHFLLMTD